MPSAVRGLLDPGTSSPAPSSAASPAPSADPFEISGPAWRAHVRRCSRILGGPADAEDCVQEALVAALPLWRAGELSHLHAFLNVASRRKALDLLRRRRAETDSLRHGADERVQDLLVGDVADAVAAREEARWLLEALRALPLPTRLVLSAIAEGHTTSTAAALLGMTPRSVENRLQRTRGMLRALRDAELASA